MRRSREEMSISGTRIGKFCALLMFPNLCFQTITHLLFDATLSPCCRGGAVEEYEEAVKRAPNNPAIRNNLAAALCKVMDFNGAKKHIEKAIELDPKYVKAWSRKGDIEVLMKENHKALESYKQGLAIDSSNAACKEGLRKVTTMINYGAATMTEEEKLERARHGMADPEIQSILQDPMIQQILKDFSENPQAANQAMANPAVRSKIEKLIASGVVQMG